MYNMNSKKGNLKMKNYDVDIEVRIEGVLNMTVEADNQDEAERMAIDQIDWHEALNMLNTEIDILDSREK